MKFHPVSGRSGRAKTTYHAEEQYVERFENDVPLISAWERGVRVNAPDKHYDEARLYPPADLLMTAKGSEITTVMYASETRIDPLGKVRCDGCGHPHEPIRPTETCPWCGSTADVGRSTGAIKLTIKGGN